MQTQPLKALFNKEYFSSGVYSDDDYKKDAACWVPLFAKKIFSYLSKIFPPKVLDVGCAYGYLIAFLQNYYKIEVDGLDISKYAIKNSEKSVKNKIKEGSILKRSNFSENKFDAVICLELFNYLTQKKTELAARNLIFWSKKYVFFSALYKHSTQISQEVNPDRHRVAALTQKEYIKIFKKHGGKFIAKFNPGGGDVLVFIKNK